MLPLAVLSLALATGPAAPSPPDAIVGGELVERGEHPAVVSISIGSFLCTGTLLTPEIVLTAAHCLQGSFLEPSYLVVGVGEDRDVPSQALGVEAFGTHEEFCNPKTDEGCVEDIHDYAWLRLATPAVIDAADLPTVVTDEALHHRIVRAGAPVELVGFGEEENMQLGLKRQVTTSIAKLSATGLELRAGKSGRDSCRGDSGGPALAELPDGGLALVGVLSRGSEECGSGGIYGAPLPALCWVRDETGVDVVPEGCEGCDCVDLTPREEDERGCAIAGRRPQGGGWWWLCVLALPWLRRHRR